VVNADYLVIPVQLVVFVVLPLLLVLVALRR
jgi:hypothetical protein